MGGGGWAGEGEGRKGRGRNKEYLQSLNVQCNKREMKGGGKEGGGRDNSLKEKSL